MISIVIAVKNGADTLARCIDSIVTQTYENKELVIIDGGSTDGTREIIRANSGHISFWESTSDGGIYHAWNKALRHVHGRWVYFLGADDYLWDPGTLQVIGNYLSNVNLDTRVVYGKVRVVNAERRDVAVVGENWEKIRERFLCVMCIPHQGVFHHRSLFEKHGDFDESFVIAGDYELLLRELKNNHAAFVTDVTVAGMQIGGLSSRGSMTRLTLLEIKRAQKKNGIASYSFLWCRIFLKVLTRDAIYAIFGQTAGRFIIQTCKRMVGAK